jgi:hypothetical protein
MALLQLVGQHGVLGTGWEFWSVYALISFFGRVDGSSLQFPYLVWSLSTG